MQQQQHVAASDGEADERADVPLSGAGAPGHPGVDHGADHGADHGVGDRAALETLSAAQGFLALAFGLGVLVGVFTDQALVAWLCAGMTACLLAQQRLLLLRRRRWRLAADLFLGELFLVFAAVTLASGGAQTTFVYLGSLVVMFAMLIRGQGLATGLALASVAVLVVGHLLHALGLPPLLEPDPEAVAVGKYYGAAILTLTTLGVMRLHARARERAERDAELARLAEQRLTREKRDLALEFERLHTLAGGVAHDFNNVLQTIVGQADLARGEPGVAPAVQQRLDAVVLAAHRAAGVVHNLLLFAGRREARLRPVDLGRLVAEQAELVRPLLSSGVALELRVEEQGGLWVQAASDQLASLVLNLLRNADEALAADGGRIRLSVRRVSVGPEVLEGCVVAAAALDGPAVQIEVADDGPGIADDVRARIFDPFFSTRAEGHGLGLATAPAIAEAHDAALCLTTSAGAGASFRLVVRAIESPPTASTSRPASAELSGLTVILADDDQAVRDVTAAFLEAAGAQVLQAADGEAALELHEQAGGVVDLALLDLAMPRLDGRGAARSLRARDSQLPLVILSGYWVDDLDGQADLAGVHLLHKPLTRAELLAGVRAALGRGEDGTDAPGRSAS